MPVRPAFSTAFPPLSPAFRPSPKEVERYAHFILAHEGRSPDALEACRREAELQLWVWRCENRRRARRRWRHETETPPVSHALAS